MSKIVATSLAPLLIVALVVPTAFFTTPQRASAATSSVGCVGSLAAGAAGLLGSAVGTIFGIGVKDPLTQGATAADAGASVGDCIYNVIIKPLARQLIHQIIKATTASIIHWIN